MAEKRICFFCERWASGGIESFIYNLLSQNQVALGEVDIVAARLEDSVFTRPLQQRGIRFFELSGNINNLPNNHRAFRRLLRERNYDGVHLHIYHGLSLYYAVIARQEGIPLRIAHSHNGALRKSAAKWLKMWIHRGSVFLFKNVATHWLSCSPVAGTFMFGTQERRKREFLWVPNGIDTKRFSMDESQRDLVREHLAISNCFVIGNVGRWCHQKNQRFLLEMLAHMAEEDGDICLLLIGEGEEEKALRQLARQYEVEDRVIFYGPSQEVEKMLWAMDLYVQPSLFEGLPLAVVEAQAAGLPVLCADSISHQVRLTKELQFLSLAAGARVWAQHILKKKEEMWPYETACKWQSHMRGQADQVRKAGYDIYDTARLLEQIYREGVWKDGIL